MRGQVVTLQHFQFLSEPDGINHVLWVFMIYEDPKHFRYLGMVDVDSDLPLKVTPQNAVEHIQAEKDIFKEDFKLKVGLAGNLLRRSLWHT